MSIYRVGSILLLSAYLFAVNKIGMSAWHDISRQNVASCWNWAVLHAFLEAHGHRRHDSVLVVVHLKDFLLLSS